MASAAIRVLKPRNSLPGPSKAGVLASEDGAVSSPAQTARKEFTDLVSAFQKRYPYLEQERTSQWMNQAPGLAASFLGLSKGKGRWQRPMFALRLYGDN